MNGNERGPSVDGVGTVCLYGSEVGKQNTQGLKWEGMNNRAVDGSRSPGQ
jgi:hypothetical protein